MALDPELVALALDWAAAVLASLTDRAAVVAWPEAVDAEVDALEAEASAAEARPTTSE